MKATVSTAWLAQHLGDDDLVILDVRLAKPKSSLSKDLYANTFIPQAINFDLEGAFSDINSSLPHMLPDEYSFGEAARHLGINANSKIVVYDNFGIYASPRVWWMFKAMGHGDIAVLDGGLLAWVKEGKPTNDHLMSKAPTPGKFLAHLDTSWISTAQEVLEKIKESNTLILDARSAGRFHGTEPEPRQGLKGGHIPNSKSLPFDQVIKNGHFLEKIKLKAIFKSLGSVDKRLTFSCGSGVTASIIGLAAYIAGFKEISVYDGSWSEWGQLSDYPIEK